MSNRPISITIIAWFLIVVAVLSAVVTGVSLGDPKVIDLLSQTPLPLPFLIGFMISLILANFIAGIGMLKQKNWARYLYAFFGLASISVNFISAPTKLAIVPGVVFYIVVLFFLFRSRANAYFKSFGDVDHAIK